MTKDIGDRQTIMDLKAIDERFQIIEAEGAAHLSSRKHPVIRTLNVKYILKSFGPYLE